MRLEFLQSHAWQVSLGRFVVLLATALVIGLLLQQPLYAVLVALLGYSIWSLVSLYQIQSWLRSRRRLPLEAPAGRCSVVAGGEPRPTCVRGDRHQD